MEKMEWTQVDGETIIENEAPERTAVMIAKVTNKCLHFLRDRDTTGYIEKQYGAFETTRHGQSNGRQYLIIQFKDAAVAMNLITKGWTTFMRGTEFWVKPFRSIDDLCRTIQHLNVTRPPLFTRSAPENSDENILNVLNDYCLGEIFRQIDSLSDIISIDNVCIAFNEIAEKNFISVLKRKTVNFSHLNPGGYVTLKDIEKFVRRYGKYIVSVNVIEDDFNNLPDVINPILKLMHEHCPTLESLMLLFKDENTEELETETLIEIRPLISKLKHLEISYNSVSKYNDFISACAEIESLAVIHRNEDEVEWDLIFPEVTFPKLKFFEFASDMALDGFLAHNPQIERLVIAHLPDRAVSVSKRMPNITELTLSGTEELITTHDAIHLNHLKRASITISDLCFDASITNLFNMKNITALTLGLVDFFDYDILAELMENLWSLEKLEFLYGSSTQPILSKNVLKKMLQHANKLKKLEIMWPGYVAHRFDEKDFGEILEIVKNRTNPLKLNIHFESVFERKTDGLCWCDETSRTILVNMDSQWLRITKRYEMVYRERSS